jgi:hypothetical protein
MRVFAAALILAIGLSAETASAQGSGGIQSGTFGTGTASARPDTVEEDLVGTPRDIRTLPRAPTLPDLTHRAPELSGEHTIASVKVQGVDDRRLSAHLFHFDFETPIIPGLYGGSEWGFAGARGAGDSGAKLVPGQPQIFGRVVHTFMRERYAVGAGLGLLPPVFTYDDQDERSRLDAASAASLVSVVRPWDLSTFLDRRFTARPWIDLRVNWRKLVAQFRQGVDLNFRTGASRCVEGSVCDRAGDIQLVSMTTFYVGWQPTREVALGVEAWEVFLLKTRLPVADRDRSALALSPSVRFYYRWVEPAVSVLFPIGQPLLNAAESYFALRIDMRVWFGGK